MKEPARTTQSLRNVIASMLVFVENHATRCEMQAEAGDPALTLVYQRSAARARRIVKVAIRAAYTAEPVPDAFLTCDGKGGTYEVIGMAKGAGPRKGEKVVVYRDVATGELYLRDPDDFHERLILAGGGGESAGTTEAKEQRA